MRRINRKSNAQIRELCGLKKGVNGRIDGKCSQGAVYVDMYVSICVYIYMYVSLGYPPSGSTLDTGPLLP